MDNYDVEKIADAIRAAGGDIEGGLNNVDSFSLRDDQWEMIPRAICSAAEIIAQGMPLLSISEIDSYGNQAGLVDGLFAISHSLDRVAHAITSSQNSI